MNVINFSNGKISPKLTSGGKRLLFTKSACFLEKNGIEMSIPIGPANKDIIFSFSFVSNDFNKSPQIKTDLINNSKIQITLINFNNPLGTGTSAPMEFNIGNKLYWLLLYASSLSNKDHPDKTLIHLTMSMYKDQN